MSGPAAEPTEMQQLIAAITAQTEAINSLADSNREVIDYLVSQEVESDGEGEPDTYLDGSPCR
ncbi:hypothetical protein [Marinobacter sp. BGYM27]|uniref:hypothetical protein n=1 Tax=Marinobacter sp. BGYM27 TaxID=2975597 RepID=UPI0021A6ACFC|nr:hypothetical protein [Marinobacter sp. BGYM27]MDG5498958.1 hypothetical protein [Marinobacter sp. BGYM27]